MHKENNQVHLYRGADISPNTIDLNKPLVCLFKSEEMSELNALMSEKFPSVHDVVGGIEGLLSNINYSELPTKEYIFDDTLFYEELTKLFYYSFESVIDDHGEFTQNGFIIDSIETEYISWDFNDLLVKACVVYRKILSDMLFATRYTNKKIAVRRLSKSPIKDVYFIEFGQHVSIDDF